jgi:hypothetical protein
MPQVLASDAFFFALSDGRNFVALRLAFEADKSSKGTPAYENRPPGRNSS